MRKCVHTLVTAMASVAAAVLSVAAPAWAQTDYARLDIGPGTQRVEPTWTGVGTAAAGAGGANLATTALTSLTGDDFSIAIDNVDSSGATVGGIDWRDRGDSTSTQPLVRVGEDFIKNNNGVIRVTLSGVEAGAYSITSYHRDPDNGQSDQIQVFLSDANGTNQLQSSFGNAGPANGAGVGGVNALTTANVQSTSATFNATSNGTDPIVVVFDGRISADDETPLNGLFIQQVPEPTAIGLCGVAALGLLARRRRKI